MNDEPSYQQLKSALKLGEDRYRALLTDSQRQLRYVKLIDQIRTTLARELDLQTTFRSVVEAIAATFGYTQVSLYICNTDHLMLQHQVGYERVLSRIPLNRGVSGRVIRTGEPILLENVQSDPEFLPAIEGITSEVCVPLRDQGTIVGILNVESINNIVLTRSDLQLMIAISEHINMAISRSRLYTAARESEERYRQLVEMSPETIGVHSEGIVVYINQAGLKLFGASRPEELIGKPVLSLVVPEYRPIVIERIRQTQELYQPIELLEEKFLRLDGTVIDVEVAAIPTTYMGKPATQIVLRDITDRKRAETQRLALERKVLEAQKMESLGVLAGGIAHDFNNLLMAILGNATLALLDTAPGTPTYEALQQIESTSQRAAKLTQQMLAYSGKGHFVVQQLDLNTVLNDMNHLLHASIDKNAELQIKLAPTLPPIEADVDQIKQVIFNLVINASEALEGKPGKIRLQTNVVSSAPTFANPFSPPLTAGPYVTLHVLDSGCGMDRDLIPRIFDPFFSTKFTGRGLGLAVVLGIIRGHKGSINVQSVPEQSTRFTIYLPVMEPRLQTTPPTLPDTISTMTQETVLVVDDEAMVRSVTQRILKRLGYNVLLCEDGVTALEIFQTHMSAISCVLLDLTMPNMNGEETFREIQRLKPNTRVILMSGYTEEDATSRFEVAGLAGFLQKPFTINDLHHKIVVVLGSNLA